MDHASFFSEATLIGIGVYRQFKLSQRYLRSTCCQHVIKIKGHLLMRVVTFRPYETEQ